MKITGKLIELFETQQVSDKFKKQEFVLETTENNGGKGYKETIKFQLTQDKCGIVDLIAIGSEVEVQFNIRGKRFEKDVKVSYFNNLDAWKVTSLDDAKRNATAFDKPANISQEQMHKAAEAELDAVMGRTNEAENLDLPF